MSVLLRSRLFMLFTAAAVAIATCGVVAAKKGGGGKPGDGGGDPPPAPPVLYSLHRFTLPADYLGEGGAIQGMNDEEELVGFYSVPDATGSFQAFYFDAKTGNTAATNLNDVQFDENFGVPPGWHIARAHDINNLGDIAGALALDGDPDQMRGCVIEMRPDPLDSSVKPRINFIPDGFWSRTYAVQINDVGVVFGRGNAEVAYVYRAPLHGQNGDNSVTEISTSFDAWFSGHVTNPVNGGPTLVKVEGFRPVVEILTYNVDAGTSNFTDVSNLGIESIGGFNDQGSFCGSYSCSRRGKKTESCGYLFDGTFQPLMDMDSGHQINNSGDVLGYISGQSWILNHSNAGSIVLNDVIVADSEEEKAIWDNAADRGIQKLTERNETGFPVLAGTMKRLDSPLERFYDGFVLFPIVP